MSEKVEHQGGVNLLKAELGWAFSQTLAGKDKQQPEGVGVRLAGMGAIAALGRHVFTQEGRDQRSNGRHRSSPPETSASAAAAMPVINSGVASKYQ